MAMIRRMATLALTLTTAVSLLLGGSGVASADVSDDLGTLQRFTYTSVRGVVYPDNTNEVRYLTGNESDRPARWVGSHPLQCWRFYDPTSNLRDSGDVAQVAGITREVMANWKVDPERVYVVGMSSGAMLTRVIPV